MYNYNIKINDREYSLLSEDQMSRYQIVEKYIKDNEISDFYETPEDFIRIKCDVQVEQAELKLWLISTDRSGYDTYDSAVYAAYTEEQAVQLSEEQMSSGRSYNRYSNHAEYLGDAYRDVELGEIVSSFNGG